VTDETEDWLDDDGYPTDATLKRVAEWPHTDIPALLDFLKSIWWCPDMLMDRAGGKLHMSTGGWSGNESIIKALQQNRIFWVMHWESSRRGGHHEFDMSRLEAKR